MTNGPLHRTLISKTPSRSRFGKAFQEIPEVTITFNRFARNANADVRKLRPVAAQSWVSIQQRSSDVFRSWY
jgi:hypothetical protein